MGSYPDHLGDSGCSSHGSSKKEKDERGMGGEREVMEKARSRSTVRKSHKERQPCSHLL